VFGSDDNRVRAVADRGSFAELLWSFQTGADVKASPLIGGDGIVYVGSMDDRLYALRSEPTASPRLVWSVDLDGDISASPAIGPNGAIYVGTQTERLFAIGP
jgi:outer membrane protein assembly factor BamB